MKLQNQILEGIKDTPAHVSEIILAKLFVCSIFSCLLNCHIIIKKLEGEHLN